MPDVSGVTPTETTSLIDLGLNRILPLSWTLLEEGAQCAQSPFRYPLLATATADGVDARVLVLRRVDSVERILEFHTDKRSAKVQQIQDNPNVIWVFYDPVRKLQLRVRGDARVIQDDRLLDATWAALGEHTKRAYAQKLTPGTPVEEIVDGAPCPFVEDPESGRANFMAIECEIDFVEWLLLDRGGHRSAIARYASPGWSSTWVMP